MSERDKAGEHLTLIMQVQSEAETYQKRLDELAAKELQLTEEKARQQALRKELDAGRQQHHPWMHDICVQ